MDYHRGVPARWFRIDYARNALLRHLATSNLKLEDLTAARAVDAMLGFQQQFRPQHGEIDELLATWGPADEGWNLTLIRRMTRHDHPERQLRLTVRLSSRPDDPNGSAPISTAIDARAFGGRAAARGRYRRGVDLDLVTVVSDST